MKTNSPMLVLVPFAMLALVIVWVSLRAPASARGQQEATSHNCVPGGETSRERFVSIMETVAEGWNRGNTSLAASCFTEDALYSAPPSPGRHGRTALYEYFGGAHGRELPMHMTWHNLLFDPAQQIGAGEYPFRYRIQTHGLVIVKISNGRIRNWREYETSSSLDWDHFIGENRF